MSRVQTTEDYTKLSENLEEILTWENERLLQHFLETRFIIMTEDRFTSSQERLGVVIHVGRREHEEILRRMTTSYLRGPVGLSDFLRNEVKNEQD